MKKTLVLGASLLLALAPSGTALAADVPTNPGKGNCGYNAAGGNRTVIWGGAGDGFGGRMSGGSFTACLAEVKVPVDSSGT